MPNKSVMTCIYVNKIYVCLSVKHEIQNDRHEINEVGLIISLTIIGI